VSLVTQVVLRKGDRLYLNDGIYGSFDELTLPGSNTDYPISVYALDANGCAVRKSAAGLALRPYGPSCDTVDVLPRPFLRPQTIAQGDFIVFDSLGAYSCAVRTNFNGFLPQPLRRRRRVERTPAMSNRFLPMSWPANAGHPVATWKQPIVSRCSSLSAKAKQTPPGWRALTGHDRVYLIKYERNTL